MSEIKNKMSKDWDNEYQKIVLKVPDGLGVEKGGITKDMLKMQHELYKVISVLQIFMQVKIILSTISIIRHTYNRSVHCIIHNDAICMCQILHELWNEICRSPTMWF